MSLSVVFEYEVELVRGEAFEAVDGSDGEWARFFPPPTAISAPSCCGSSCASGRGAGSRSLTLAALVILPA